MSGLTRSETRARCPRAAAAAAMRAISSSLSAFHSPMPCSSPSAISASVLPTPANTMRSAGKPARRAASSSPPETMSAPAPSPAKQPQERAVAVGLDRVADPVRHAREGASRTRGTRPRAPRGCRRRAASRARPPPARARRRRTRAASPSRREAAHAAAPPAGSSARLAASSSRQELRHDAREPEHAHEVREDLQAVHQVAPGPDQVDLARSRRRPRGRSRPSGRA